MFSCLDDSLGSDNEVLEIPFISRDKAGVYECTAANDIAVDTQTVELIVNCKCLMNLYQHILHIYFYSKNKKNTYFGHMLYAAYAYNICPKYVFFYFLLIY